MFLPRFCRLLLLLVACAGMILATGDLTPDPDDFSLQPFLHAAPLALPEPELSWSFVELSPARQPLQAAAESSCGRSPPPGF
jgi:hypothetical protein